MHALTYETNGLELFASTLVYDVISRSSGVEGYGMHANSYWVCTVHMSLAAARGEKRKEAGGMGQTQIGVVHAVAVVVSLQS